MNIEGQGHSLILVKGHSDSTCSNFRRIEVKFHMEPPWDGGKNGSGHMTNMATMPIYGKVKIDTICFRIGKR